MVINSGYIAAAVGVLLLYRYLKLPKLKVDIVDNGIVVPLSELEVEAAPDDPPVL